MLCARSHSTIALEQGAQQACSSILLHPSGTMIAACLDIKHTKIGTKLQKKLHICKKKCNFVPKLIDITYDTHSRRGGSLPVMR